MPLLCAGYRPSSLPSGASSGSATLERQRSLRYQLVDVGGFAPAATATQRAPLPDGPVSLEDRKMSPDTVVLEVELLGETLDRAAGTPKQLVCPIKKIFT
jgi:hypothetical protein